MEIVIYSDGGGQKSSTSAGACIIETPKGKEGFAIFLGEATNNESEISAGLLALSILANQYPDQKIKFRWVCDSEYVLKSATEYIKTWQKNNWKTAAKQDVKNQGLWRCFLALSEQMEIKPFHVRGHTGHPENETCDSVSTWCRFNADNLLKDKSFSEFKLTTDVGISNWILVDGRRFLEILRENFDSESIEEAIACLQVDPREAKLRLLKSQLEKAQILAKDLGEDQVAETLKPLIANL